MKNKTELLYGIRPVIEAIESGRELEKILFQKGLKGELVSELRSLARERMIPMQPLPTEALNKVTGKNHQGVIAYIAEVTYVDLEEVLMRIFEEGRSPLVLVLDHITDVRNFGSIARTAECAGVDVIVTAAKGGAMINADAVKTSAGALLKIAVNRSFNLAKSIDLLKGYGVQVVACTEKSGELYYENDYSKPTAIVLGSEDKGIETTILQKADAIAKIPLMGSIDSLNVSVSNGIILYETVRQRSLQQEK
ncbi:MAG: 23S rRNA (guanosine(2251)-2'-O)-methyltransferase RlmB [Bacteroidales bacterium]|nr:23S rRNA (guanosine(2251)-2'-O)-methyltransferase RlmB [Bacteroidales bacterium]MCF8334232.1 23S rRNA (guanosine(2251)-2'-O)-methyltransferase RlmB [Bacteroidales bacterium]